MTKGTAIPQRAKQLGIADAYWDVDGTRHHIDENTLRYFIAALDNTQNTPADFSEVRVLCANTTQALTFSYAVDEYTLTDEQQRVIKHASIGSDTLHLPELASGYYTLTTENRQGETAIRLIVAPDTCYRPPAMEQRQLQGLTVQLYSLRSDNNDALLANWGIGDFADLYDAVTLAARRGWDFIGINPLHALYPSNPQWFSPYSPSSRIGLHWLYLSIGKIPEFTDSADNRAWFEDNLTEIDALRHADIIDYTAVSALKMQALRLAFNHFEAQGESSRRSDFEAFLGAGGDALRKYSVFYAICEYENHSALGYLGFSEALQDVNSPAVEAFAHEHPTAIRFYSYLQWLIDEQLSAIQQHARKRGLVIGLYGDLAVGVAAGSADSWVNPDLFSLPAAIGAPPDPLGPIGQNWGLPPMHPQVLQQQGFQPFIELLRANMKHCGALRIDHVMGLYRLWLIPEDKDASHGAYIHYPFETLMAILAIESQRAKCLVIGEDLGTVPNEVRDTLARYQVLSYDVLYFAGRYDTNGWARWRKPSAVNPESLGVIGTHDLPSLSGWWHCHDLQLLGELGILSDADLKPLFDERLHDKQALLNALKADGYLPDNYVIDALRMAMHEQLNHAIHAYARDADTRLFAIQPENVCGVEWAFNVPGTTDEVPNWRRKLPCPLTELPLDISIIRRTTP